MILNAQVRNAARLIAFLNPESPTNMSDFAKANPELSIYFMDQIARKLRKAGLIKSQRGPGGGYLLANRNITVMSLIYVFGGMRQGTDDLTAAVEMKLNEIVIAREERAHHAAAH